MVGTESVLVGLVLVVGGCGGTCVVGLVGIGWVDVVGIGSGWVW